MSQKSRSRSQCHSLKLLLFQHEPIAAAKFVNYRVLTDAFMRHLQKAIGQVMNHASFPGLQMTHQGDL
eukprot:m.736301 g.736301  ORF g.736301 m.736301 type:complete len:68 (+) comp58896_c0_seq20:1311-1514(+)